MPRQVAILHGWSDSSDSFEPLAAFLKRNGYSVVPIFLGDYVSLRDDVRIEDVAKRMEEVVRDQQARTGRNKLDARFDLIVHSTGGLVARRWISSHYAGRPCPVQNLVMLAPANFGSRLAHIGRSMVGRVAKGWRTGFETGEEMLYALELASPFQWDLAGSDLFVPEGETPASVPAFYGKDKVRPFVIVGSFPYQELAAKITNENGSDGTVRVAAANLNSRGMTVDFSGAPERLHEPDVRPWQLRGGDDNQFPLAVLCDRTHGDVISPDEKGGSRDAAQQAQLGELILQALATTPAGYDAVRADWQAVNEATRRLAGDDDERKRLFRGGASADYYHEHFQIVVRAEDEFGEPIPDYFVTFVKKPKRELFSLRANLDRQSVFFHDEVLESTHTHRRHPDHRSFYIDRYDMMKSGGWYDQIPDPANRELSFSVTAADPGDRIAYFERRRGARGIVFLHKAGEPADRWLKRHTTHFIRVIVPRAADASVFKLKRG